MIKEHTYFVKGMHCASCEILVEKKLLEIKEIKSVEATTSNGKVTIEYEGEKPSIEKLNDIFKKDNYTFFNEPYINAKAEKPLNKNLLAFNIAIFIVIAFLFLDKVGISGF